MRFTQTMRGLNYNIFIPIDNKKLYFYEMRWCNSLYAQLCREQDIRSPHCYFTDSFHPTAEDIFIDIRSTEGKEALDVIDKVKEAYLFEKKEKWLTSLNKTFEPYDNVHIISSYVGNRDGDGCCRLDSLFQDKSQHYFIKMDVEGAEMEVLKGALELLTSPNVKIAVTTYHRNDDERVIKKYLEEQGFVCEYSTGYMLFPSDDIKKPYFRRGLIRAIKKTL